MDEPVENTTTHWWDSMWCKRIRRWVHRVGFFLILYILSTGPLYWKWYEAHYVEGPIFYQIFFFPVEVACKNEFVNNFFHWYVSWWS